MFNGNLKKWAAVSVLVLTILLTISLGLIADSYIKRDAAEGTPSILRESYQSLLIIVSIAVVSGLIAVWKESIIAIKVFVACFVLLTLFYVYNDVNYLTREIAPGSFLFFFVKWFPILAALLAYKVLSRMMIIKKDADENEKV